MGHSKHVYDLVVVGGGAAGFFGAINLGRIKPGSRILIVEKSQKLLSKVSISGGGRCNVTHHCFEVGTLVKNYPRGEKELRQAFTRFQPADTVKWFAACGVSLKTEADGRMFPITDNSQTIVQTLLHQAEVCGVEIRTGTQVDAIQPVESGFEITLGNGEQLASKKMLLACGGFPKKASYHFIEALGLNIIDPVPSLFTFVVPDESLKQLAGVSVQQAHVQAPGVRGTFTGPLLITHHGVSGPAVLKLSAFGARAFHETSYQFMLGIGWLGELSYQEVTDVLNNLRADNNKKLVVNAKPDSIPQRLWEYLMKRAGLGDYLRWAEVGSKGFEKLVETLYRQQVSVTGKNTFKDEFVTCGGIDLKEIDFRSMESKKVPGLYTAGEVLNIDGVTGGFNFQNAWTTAYLAASHMATVL